MFCEDLPHNWLTLVCPAAPPKMSLLIRKGGPFTDSTSPLWLLWARGLGIAVGCWWLIYIPEDDAGRAGLSEGLSWVLGQEGEKDEATECRSQRGHIEGGAGIRDGGGHRRKAICITIYPQAVPKELFEGKGNRTLLFFILNALCFQDID